MSKTEIIPIEYGKSVLPENQIFENGAEDKVRPILFMIYLIKTENRLILADAGCTTMPGFEMEDFIGPIKALEKLNIKTGDITDIIITHAHHDHIECADCFENSAVYIQRDEYESGKDYLKNAKITLFDGEIQVSHDVKAVKIGGHSKGSCIVEVTCDNDKFIIAGDECYLRECLTKKIPTGCSYSKEKSRDFVEEYSKSEYNVLLCHDL